MAADDFVVAQHGRANSARHVLPNHFDSDVFRPQIRELQIIRVDSAQLRQPLQPARDPVPAVARRPEHPRRVVDPRLGNITTTNAARNVSDRNAKPIGSLDRVAVHTRDVEEERGVVAALDAHHRPAAKGFAKRRMIPIQSRDDLENIGRQQRPFRSGDRERLLRDAVFFPIRGDAHDAFRFALGDRDSQRERIGVEEPACAITPIIERDDGERLRGTAKRRRIRRVHHFRRHEQRDDSRRRRQREGALEEDDRQIGLMKCSVAACRGAEQPVAIAVHAFRARLDAAIAYPGRISDHHVEAAAGHHMREMDVVREKIELAIFSAVQQPSRVGDALM